MKIRHLHSTLLLLLMSMLFVVRMPAQAQSRSGSRNQQNESVTLKDKGMFLRVELSKKSAYVNEPVLCTLKLYNPGLDIVYIRSTGNADYGSCDIRANISSENAYYVGREKVDGKVYNVAIVSQVVLFPVQSGSVSVQCPGVEVGLADYTNVDPFFGFMRRRTTTAAVGNVESCRLKVNALPQAGRPKDFTGAVGNFKIDLSVPSGKLVKDNECVCVFRISGVGSLEDTDFPNLDSVFPESLKLVSVSADDSVRLDGSDVIANGVYEVVFIPKSTGKAEIPAVKFNYFNPDTKKYETAVSQPKEIIVHSSNSSSSGGPVYI